MLRCQSRRRSSQEAHRFVADLGRRPERLDIERTETNVWDRRQIIRAYAVAYCRVRGQSVDKRQAETQKGSVFRGVLRCGAEGGTRTPNVSQLPASMKRDDPPPALA